MRQWAARSLPASEVTRILGAGALPIHLVQEWGDIASNGHGGALDHRAGGDRGVSLCFRFRCSASFSCSRCSATFPQSIAAWLLDFGCCCRCRELEEGWGWAWADCGVVLACSWCKYVFKKCSGNRKGLLNVPYYSFT